MDSKTILFIFLIPFLIILWAIGWILVAIGEPTKNFAKKETKRTINKLKDEIK